MIEWWTDKGSAWASECRLLLCFLVRLGFFQIVQTPLYLLLCCNFTCLVLGIFLLFYAIPNLFSLKSCIALFLLAFLYCTHFLCARINRRKLLVGGFFACIWRELHKTPTYGEKMHHKVKLNEPGTGKEAVLKVASDGTFQ